MKTHYLKNYNSTFQKNYSLRIKILYSRYALVFAVFYVQKCIKKLVPLLHAFRVASRGKLLLFSNKKETKAFCSSLFFQ